MLAFALGFGLHAAAGEPAKGLTKGTPEIKSAGAMAFGPHGMLFVGDSIGAKVYAIETGDDSPATAGGSFQVEGIKAKLASLMGATAADIQVNDLAVNPASGRAYLSITKGQGAEASPAIVRVDRSGKIEPVSLENVNFAATELPNAPAAGNRAGGRGPSPRTMAITDIAYLDGKVYVAGLSNEEFSSRFLAIPYPFEKAGEATSVEIYHGSHAQLETKSPIRTFTPFSIKGENYLMAAYTCTPLVKVPVASLKPGSHIKGITIAELGNRNQPLDMIVYKKDDRTFLLLANSSRGVMKIETEGADSAKPIDHRVPDKEGLPYQTIKDLKGVVQLDKLSDHEAILLKQAANGSLDLVSIELP